MFSKIQQKPWAFNLFLKPCRTLENITPYNFQITIHVRPLLAVAGSYTVLTLMQCPFIFLTNFYYLYFSLHLKRKMSASIPDASFSLQSWTGYIWPTFDLLFFCLIVAPLGHLLCCTFLFQSFSFSLSDLTQNKSWGRHPSQSSAKC